MELVSVGLILRKPMGGDGENLIPGAGEDLLGDRTSEMEMVDQNEITREGPPGDLSS